MQEIKRQMQEMRLNPDPDGLAMVAYNDFRDPDYGMSYARRMLGAAQPGFQQYARTARAMGGSMAGAVERGEAARRRQEGSAFEAALSMRGQFDSLGMQALGMHFGNRQFQLGQAEAVRQADQNRRSSFLNNIIGGAVALGGAALAPATGGASLGLTAGALGGMGGGGGYQARYDPTLSGTSARIGF